VDTRSRIGLALIDVARSMGEPIYRFRSALYLRGNSLRDATGLCAFTDFVNQLQFADVGNELNDRVLKTDSDAVEQAGLKGRTVTFTARCREGKADPPCANWSP